MDKVLLGKLFTLARIEVLWRFPTREGSHKEKLPITSPALLPLVQRLEKTGIFCIDPDMLHDSVYAVQIDLQSTIPCGGKHVEDLLLSACICFHGNKHNFPRNFVIWMLISPLLTKNFTTFHFCNKEKKTPRMRIILSKTTFKYTNSIRFLWIFETITNLWKFSMHIYYINKRILSAEFLLGYFLSVSTNIYSDYYWKFTKIAVWVNLCYVVICS